MSVVVPTSLHVFPECPTYGFNVQPQYLVKIAAQEGGFERVGRRWPRPLNIFSAVPMGDRDEAVIQNVLYFWHAMGGRATTFLFKDWADYKSCPVGTDVTAIDQPLETVTLDDASTAYQLTKVYQAGPITQVREITQPKGDTIVVANASGIAQTDFTLDEATGVLKPGGGFTGAPHSWGGEFYVPVRFDSELDMQVVDKQIQTVSFTLREKRIKLATTFVGGITWTRGADPPAFIAAIAAGAGVIVGTSDVGDVYASSDVAETWTLVAPAAGAVCVAFAGGKFVVGCVGAVIISTDGFTWGAPVAIASAAGFDIISVAGDGGGNWVALDDQTFGDNYALSDDDGATWSAPGDSSISTWQQYSLIYDSSGAQFVAVGFPDSTGVQAVYTSADSGSTWTENLLAADVVVTANIALSVAHDGTHFLIGFNSDDFPADTRVASTPAGLTTATSHATGLGSSGTDDPGPGVFGAAGLLFAFGDDGGVASSTDGVAWDIGTLNMPGSGPGSVFVAVCYDDTTNTFVAVTDTKASYTP